MGGGRVRFERVGKACSHAAGETAGCSEGQAVGPVTILSAISLLKGVILFGGTQQPR